MPTTPAKNGYDAAAPAPIATARPWDSPMFDYSVVDPVPVMLGGVERGLLYTNRALKAIQRATGKNPFDAREWGDLMRDPDGLATLLWAGLLHESPDLSVDQVDDWILLPRTNYYVERLWYAYRDALPEPEPATATPPGTEVGDDPNPDPAPTG